MFAPFTLVAVGTISASGCTRAVPTEITAANERHPNAAAPQDCSADGGFPNGARLAVSLTYDDALPTHIATVRPALAAHNLPATFFINTGRFEQGAFLEQAVESWKLLRTDGHEFGSHTVNHPCDADWVEPGNNLADYDLDRMAGELDDSVRFLESLGARAPFTFAYPCGQSWVQDAQTSYKPLVQDRFLAARGTNWGPAHPKTMQWTEIPGFAVVSESEDNMVGWLDEPANEGTWMVFTIHGVGGDSNSISEQAHQSLLTYLSTNRKDLYVDTFGKVATYIDRCM
jgi:peptidoglycan/xylan/chitin deacetylase (PgdA/CDA1 family)